MKPLSLGIALAAVVGASAATASNPEVVLETTAGDIRLELYEGDAPRTVENFLTYVDEGFYSGTIFHRVIPDFVIQGGGFTADLERRATRDPIVNEADNGLRNRRGTLSMARTSEPDSATSQFFVNLSDNAFLDHGERGFGYAVFARVVDGMGVVERIAGAETSRRNGMADVPVEPVVIEAARRVAED